MRPRTELGALALLALSGCGSERMLNGGLYALPTARGHLPVGGIVSAQAGLGNVVYLGGDATLRATGDYGHGALGFHVAAIADFEGPTPYARLGYAPIGLSVRDADAWYAMNTSLELGMLLVGRRTNGSTLYVTSDRSRSAFSLGVRADLEYRPGQEQVDVFVSLVGGITLTNLTTLRGH